MSDLADPQNFTLSSVVSKNSKSKEYKNAAGFTSNKRLLVIKKGYLYYYSNVPKNYKNDASTLDNLKDVPKCSIEILNIKKINGFQPNSNYFSIQFQAKHMMEKQDIRKTMTLQQFNFTPKNTKQYITWQFTCDNVAIKQNWVNSLESLKVHYTKEKAQMQSFFDNIQNKKDGQESISHRNSMNMPWIEKNNESNNSLRKSQISKSYSSGKIPGNLSPTPGGKLQGDSPEKSPSLSKSNSYTQLQTSNVNILKGQSMIHPIVIREQEQYQQDQLKQNENDSNEDNEEENQGYQLRNQQFIRQQPIRFEQIKEQSQFSQISDEEKRYNKKDLLLKESLDASIIDRPDTPEKRVGFLDDSLSNQNQSQQDFANEQPKSEQNKQIPIEAEQNISQTKSIKKYPNQLSVQNHKKGIVYKSRSLQINSQLKSMSIRKLTSTQSRPISDLIKITTYQFKVSPQSNFYELLYFSCNKEYSFQKRVEAQKKLNALVGTFTNKSIKTFTQFINTKGHNRKTSSRFNQQKINEDLSSLQIGTMRFKIGYVNTQTVLINGKQRIYYNQSQVKQLKKQMKVYDQINKMIAQQIKMINDSKSNDLQNTLQLSLFKSQAKIDNQLPPSSQKIQSNQQVSPIGNKISISQLRVPLCTYFQYKGVCAMSFDQTLAVSEKQISDKQKLGQLKEMMKKMGFNSTFLEFKSLKTEVGEVFIIYINSSNDIYINKPSKHHHVTFQSPMNTEFLKKAAKEGSSVSIQSLLKYIKAMNQIKDTSMFTCPKEQILIALQYCYLCKHLRKFYRATHAQIDESKFINLLLKGDSNITRLFQSSGFEFQARKNDSTQILGIFFQFLLYYLGIKCQVDIENLQKYGQLIPLGIQKKNSQKNSDKIVKMVKVLPRIIGFNLQFFQLYQTFKKIDHYLNNKSKQLVYKALEYKQSTYFQNPFQIKSYPWAAYTQCLYNSAQLNYIQNDYITSITKSKQYLCTASPLPDEQEGRWQIPTPSCCIPVYFLMMKCYSKFSRQKFNELLRQILDSTIYNFGQESSVTLTVFSFAALTFVGIGEYGQAQNFLQVAIKVGQKIYGPYKKLRLAELYIDYWKILKQQNKTEKAEQQFKKAQKIIQSYGTYEQKVNLELQGLEGMLKQSQLIEGQQKAMQMLHNLQKLLKKSSARISIVKRYYKIIYQIGIKYQKSQIYDRVIEQLWKIDTNSKVIAIQYAFKLVSGKIKSLPNQLQPLVKKYSLSKEKSLLKIEEKLKHYKNMTQMLLQSFTEFEQDLICAFLKILPPGSVKFT